jgi:hypothetical protein
LFRKLFLQKIYQSTKGIMSTLSIFTIKFEIEKFILLPVWIVTRDLGNLDFPGPDGAC